MSTNKPEALRLSDAIEHAWFENAREDVIVEDVQNELRRLQSEVERLKIVADTDKASADHWRAEAGRLRQMVAFQGMDDTADIPAILKRKAT
jgi:phage terminase large subunit